MSFESARKMGLTSSLISIIVPVIAGILYASLLISIFSAASAIPYGTIGFNSLLFFNSAFLVIIALAVVALAGYILFMVSMYQLSKYYGEPAIFKNLLYALIIQVILGVVISVGIFAFTASAASRVMPTSTATSVSSTFLSIIILTLVLVLVSVVIGIVCALLYKRAFDNLAEKSGVDNFKTTGLLYLIGTILSVIGVGVIIIWIGWIFAAMGYHKLAPTNTNTYTSPMVPASVVGTSKRCPVCGSENAPDAIYCGNCGNQL
jgi:uncharacterized membrane protein